MNYSVLCAISYESPIGVHVLRKIWTTFCHATSIWPIIHIKTSLKNLFFSLKEWINFRSQHTKISEHIQIYCYSLFLENSLLSFPFSFFSRYIHCIIHYVQGPWSTGFNTMDNMHPFSIFPQESGRQHNTQVNKWHKIILDCDKSNNCILGGSDGKESTSNAVD